jgi:hypothetical protein
MESVVQRKRRYSRAYFRSSHQPRHPLAPGASAALAQLGKDWKRRAIVFSSKFRWWIPIFAIGNPIGVILLDVAFASCFSFVLLPCYGY